MPIIHVQDKARAVPLVAGPAPFGPLADKATAGSAAPRVLVVDDNLANLAAFEATLAGEGFDLVKAESGADAMRHLLIGEFAAILLDINMPSIDGIETARLIRQRDRTRDVPIIFITAYQPDASQLLEGYASGAADYLVKPVSPEILRSKVRIFVELFRKNRQVESQAEQLRVMNRRLREEVAQRREAERDAVFEREERQRVTLASIADAVITTDVEGRVLSLNAVAEELTGRRDGEARGLPLCEVVRTLGEPGQRVLEDVVGEALASGETIRIGRSEEVVAAAARPRYVEYSVSPVRDRRGEAIGTVVILHEVTDRHEMELERLRALRLEKSARQAAEAANRMRDEFLAVISHELRNPLNSIVGWTEILRAVRASGGEALQAVNAIHRGAMAQKKLIEDLLDMSRIINGKMELSLEPVRLGDVVQAAVEAIRPLAESKRLALVMPAIAHGGDPGVPAVGCAEAALAARIRADRARLDQVIGNVLGNAVKFTPADGSISVRIALDGDAAEVVVADDGDGIAADFLPHVFDAFRQADSTITRRQGGLGLGLAIARQLVELHGGTISATSAGAGCGTQVSIRLPLWRPAGDRPGAPAGDSARALRRATAEPDAPSLADIRLLVVDDDVETLEMLALLTRAAGAEVKTATNAVDALRMVREWAPDVLLSDISMPGQDGYALIREVRALSAGDGGTVAAVALTAMATEGDRTRALDAGFHAHIAKPLELATLIRTIGALVPVRGALDCGRPPPARREPT